MALTTVGGETHPLNAITMLFRGEHGIDAISKATKLPQSIDDEAILAQAREKLTDMTLDLVSSRSQFKRPKQIGNWSSQDVTGGRFITLCNNLDKLISLSELGEISTETFIPELIKRDCIVLNDVLLSDQRLRDAYETIANPYVEKFSETFRAISEAAQALLDQLIEVLKPVFEDRAFYQGFQEYVIELLDHNPAKAQNVIKTLTEKKLLKSQPVKEPVAIP